MKQRFTRNTANVCITYQLGRRKVSRLYENKTARDQSAALMKILLESDDYRSAQTGLICEKMQISHKHRLQAI